MNRISRDTQPVRSHLTPAFKKYEKNYEKYKKYKEFFDSTSDTAPKFINHDAEYKSNEDNWTERRKY